MSLKLHERDLGRCTFCPKLCRFCCPTAEAEHRETVSPWFKMSLAEMVRQKNVQVNADIGEVFYHCLSCLHCRTHCKHEVDVPSALMQARSLALAGGKAPAAVHEILERFGDSGNPFGEDLQKELRQHVDERYFEPEVRAVVFAGCQAIRDGQENLKPVFDLFESIDVDFVGVFHGSELCCGIPLLQAGDMEAFSEHARKVAAQLTRVRTVICPCPTCAYVLDGLFKNFNVELSPQVLTLDEFLIDSLKGRKAARKLPGSYVYHDPCYLVRYLDRPDGVRDLLSLVLEEPLLEAHWMGQDASCCGGGGLVPLTMPDVAQKVAQIRSAQLKDSGAQKSVTACPGCKLQLNGVSDGLPSVDYVQLLVEGFRDKR